jgi:hypothetical protein
MNAPSNRETALALSIILIIHLALLALASLAA